MKPHGIDFHNPGPITLGALGADCVGIPGGLVGACGSAQDYLPVVRMAWDAWKAYRVPGNALYYHPFDTHAFIGPQADLAVAQACAAVYANYRHRSEGSSWSRATANGTVNLGVVRCASAAEVSEAYHARSPMAGFLATSEDPCGCDVGVGTLGIVGAVSPVVAGRAFPNLFALLSQRRAERLPTFVSFEGASEDAVLANLPGVVVVPA